ncbi:MAG TPA: ABC-type transport auxiliary lipoprotein family protein [Allosphingosinicella sp.]|nr:ABC-type transport auxiliary lipoprotein family protein [Allosphingosinicella sp.]
MGRRLFLVLGAAALGLSGCFGGGGPSELLTLTPTQSRTATGPRAAAEGRLITVTTPSAPHALNNNRVPVYVSDTIIQYLKDAYWVDEPAELFRNLLSETIAAQTSYVVIDPALYTQAAGTTVSGQMLRFGLDPTRMEAVVQFEAAVSRPNQPVLTNRFEARVPVAEATRAAVAPALNAAANQVAAEVTAWLG